MRNVKNKEYTKLYIQQDYKHKILSAERQRLKGHT